MNSLEPMELCGESKDLFPTNILKAEANEPTSMEEVILMPKEMILINLIAKEPAIFNIKHEHYRNVLIKDEIWMKISRRVGWTEKKCKSKWKATRDQYCRELKRARSNSNAVIRWKHFEHLDFLRPYALSRKSQLGDSKDDSQIQSSNSQENSLSSSLTMEKWNNESNFCEMSDSELTSQIIEHLSQSDTKMLTDEKHEDDGNDDDDDDEDPIHTFLNIESYFEKELISMIKRNAFIYNSAHPFYRNMKRKMQVWEDIARKLNKTVPQCRSKWKALRDQFIREHKRLRNKTKGKSSPRWKHYNKLEFLEKFLKHKSKSNVMKVENEKAEVSIEHINVEQLDIPMNENNKEITHYIVAEEETSQALNECEENQDIESQSSAENNESCVKETNFVQEPSKHEDDEVGAFFRALAIKIRNANISSSAFTDLQIDILKVISTALRDS